jgi:membrane-associated protease RseP (regulator of RpoE activity)
MRELPPPPLPGQDAGERPSFQEDAGGWSGPYGPPQPWPPYASAPRLPRGPRRRWRLAGTLFGATVGSTLLAGYLMSGNIGQAAGYSAAIMTILLLHEMGHFLMCMRYHVPATPPYFIPMPLTPFGTMGALILMPPSQRSLRSILDIGAAGPLAGLVVAVPVAYLGLKLSQVLPAGANAPAGGLQLGDSVLFWLLSRAAHGSLPSGAQILLHPVGLAGWAGLFVTGHNLLPIGQLDGGHVMYALLGPRARYVGYAFMAAFALWTIFAHHGWWLMLVLLLLLLHRGHPPALDPRPLDRRRIAVGVFRMIVFVLTFVPRPIVIIEP